MPKLPTRKLGKDGPEVTALGFGTMGMSVFYGATGSEEERLNFLDELYATGCTNWDSADMYGDSEVLLGKWFQKSGKRDDVFLATKFAPRFLGPGKIIMDNNPAYIKEACDKSLGRLGTDHIDLYYCHRFSGQVSVEDIVGAMKELQDEGKVKYLGLCECSADSLRRASKIAKISAVQIEYSPFTLDIEKPDSGLLEACRELGVAVVCYSPLGRGMLTGRFTSPDDFAEGDWRKNAPRFSKENFPKNLELVNTLNEIAKKKGCTSGQLSLAWLMAQGDEVIPIPGTKNLKYLKENLGALDVQLSPQDVQEIRAAVEKAEVAGGRYPEFLAKLIVLDTPQVSASA